MDSESLSREKGSALAFYNFEVRTESHVMLTEGAELTDSSAARVEAARRIGELLTNHAGQIWVDEDWKWMSRTTTD
jgi:hypothetical protein